MKKIIVLTLLLALLTSCNSNNELQETKITEKVNTGSTEIVGNITGSGSEEIEKEIIEEKTIIMSENEIKKFLKKGEELRSYKSSGKDTYITTTIINFSEPSDEGIKFTNGMFFIKKIGDGKVLELFSEKITNFGQYGVFNISDIKGKYLIGRELSEIGLIYDYNNIIYNSETGKKVNIGKKGVIDIKGNKLEYQNYVEIEVDCDQHGTMFCDENGKTTELKKEEKILTEILKI